MHPGNSPKGFTLIELLVVIAIIAILAVVVVLTLNPAQLLAQSRDANRVSDMATLQSALNLYVTDQAGASTFSLGNASDTYPSIWDPNATSTLGDQCQGLSMLSLNTSTGQSWQCPASSSYRNIGGTGWIPVNFSSISAGSPVSDLPVDPTNQTSTGLFYAYNTNGSQFQVTAELESTKYKAQYASSPDTNLFPDVISGGTQGISALYNPTGLVGYWPLNEGTGSSTIDASGNGNTGTWNGSAIGSNGTYYTSGKVGPYAGDFDGTSTYVRIPNSSALSISGSQLSITAWVYLNITTSSTIYLIRKGDVSTGCAYDPPYSLELSGQYAYLRTTNSSCTSPSSPSGSLSVGTWHYLVGTFDGSNVYFYVDGSFKGSSVATGSLYTTNQDLAMNSYIENGVPYYPRLNGLLDDVRIYNRVLSPAEVMALYNAEK